MGELSAVSSTTDGSCPSRRPSDINFTKPHDYFGAFFHACITPTELSKLNTVLRQGWSETDLADFARWHTGKPFFAMNRRMLMASINSALQGDRFAKQFFKEREHRPIALHASRPSSEIPHHKIDHTES